MTAAAVVAARTGGPSDDDHPLLEQIAGWVLTIVLAMLIARFGPL
ncbi:MULTISPECIES: SCO1431 family membrane protein [Streptomyces]|nr:MULTISPECIES: SCO1431 family membrane protein [Streptomyces]MZE76594.1 SCO1431 family membrane protein [Streptomyces sp. SID5475]MCC3650067.1 SCO1431 family membrane protein [Streptomyces sp. S07_1.15]MCC5037196.1 SCO1431 family membrane protein [Streptomyces sp. WAC 00631]MCC9737797.1 SCO1431 family membrane protein [Streptomyces sp. MNU89]WSQ74906.1 SCO1431 family membrane protein [Streptomyces xinghaiensis]